MITLYYVSYYFILHIITKVIETKKNRRDLFLQFHFRDKSKLRLSKEKNIFLNK